MDEGTTKTCNTCSAVKILTDFSRDARVKDGRSAQCKLCKSAARKAYRAILRETGPLYDPKRLAGQRGCNIDGCDRRHYGRGWCAEHHRNWSDRGDPLAYPVRVNGGPCAVDECPERAKKRGWCEPHYKAWYSHGDPLIRKRTAPPNNGRCSFDGCPDAPTSGTGKWCRKHYSRWRRHRDPSVAMTDRRKYSQCQHCSASTGGLKFCSKRCSSRHIRGVPLTTACRTCGASFPTREHQAFCSEICRLESKRASARRTAKLAPITNPRYKDHVRRQALNRRARKLAAFVESFSPQEIHERDNWTCGICTEPIDPTLRWPDRWCATIDHKIPLARGGRHERANVQSAHLTCNCSKNARLPDEIAS